MGLKLWSLFVGWDTILAAAGRWGKKGCWKSESTTTIGRVVLISPGRGLRRRLWGQTRVSGRLCSTSSRPTAKKGRKEERKSKKLPLLPPPSPSAFPPARALRSVDQQPLGSYPALSAKTWVSRWCTTDRDCALSLSYPFPSSSSVSFSLPFHDETWLLSTQQRSNKFSSHKQTPKLAAKKQLGYRSFNSFFFLPRLQFHSIETCTCFI